MASLDRREFLRRSVITGVSVGAGAGLVPAARADQEASTESAAPSVKRYARLGRTGLEVSDISFGSSRLRSDTELVRHAFDRGINYFDTAEGYTGGAAEETIGRALGTDRERVYLASKTKANPGDTVDVFMARLEASLKRLRTDRVEVYFNHAINSLDRLQVDDWYEFLDRAKQQGKIRYTGVSGHGGQLVDCLDYLLDNDLVDVILAAYNFGQDPAFYERFTRRLDFIAVQPDLPRVLKKARDKNVGVVAMKTLHGAKLNEMRPYETEEGTFAQAAFRWVLNGGLADNLIVTMQSNEMVDEYLGASGAGKPTGAALSLLDRYVNRNAARCRYGCNECLGNCPNGVEIPEVMRTRMYAEDYEDLALAREDYAKIAVNASACASCSNQLCLGSCPQRIAIPERTKATHSLLA